MMDQKDFDRILKRYLHGEATDEERRLVERWYASIEDTRPELTRLEKLRLKWGVWQKVKSHKAQSARTQADAEDAPVRPMYRLLWAGSVAAALCAIVLYMVWLPAGSNAGLQEGQQTVINEGTSAKIVQLADGSRVSLSPGGTLHIIEAYNKTSREVALTGEAFFEVEKDATRPFYVHTSEVTTKVLGTSFTVNANRPDVVVSVRTGKVSVFSRKESPTKSGLPELILTPNQQAIYHANSGIMSRVLVEEPVAVISEKITNITITFDSEKVPAIVDELSKSYGITIDYDRALLNSCTLSTFIDLSEGIYERLDIICDAIGATYAVDGVVIKINSKGCKGKTNP